MNFKKLIAVIFIWIVVTAGWTVLGGTVAFRTETLDRKLQKDVAGLWGPPQVQKEPVVEVAGTAEGKATRAAVATSDVAVDIDTKPRKRGLLWFFVYHVRFKGTYTIVNDGDSPQSYAVRFQLPESAAEFAEQEVAIDGEALPEWTPRVTTPALQPGKSSTVSFSYASQGTESWKYDLPDGTMIRDLTATVRINRPDYDFDVDDPDSSPPDERHMDADAEGEYVLVWHKKLVTNARDIAVKMPRPQQPGPLVARISFFAPVSLFFFFVVMVTIQVVRKLSLHPMHYLFLSAAFFAFHLLMAYLVDHVDLHLSFWIGASASVFLVVMYLWLVAGPRAALAYAGLAQLVYLVLFSYSFFLEGLTGLTVTVGAVVTLAVLMLLTAKIRWGETMPELERKAKPALAPVGVASPSGGPQQNMPGFTGEGPNRPEPPPSA